jgi:hypothetical protein
MRDLLALSQRDRRGRVCARETGGGEHVLFPTSVCDETVTAAQQKWLKCTPKKFK